MKNSKLKVHYLYLVPLLVLQIFATILLASVMSVDDYARFVLYQTTINLLYLMTLGAPDGYLLTNRKKSKSEISGIAPLLRSYSLALIVLSIVISIVIMVLDLNKFYYLAVIASFFVGIYQLTQSIFRTLNEAHKLNIYLILVRMCFVLDGIMYIYTHNIIKVIIFDILCRMLIVIVALVQVLFEYRGNDQNGIQLRGYIKSGFLIMISNLVFSFSLMIDKYALSSDLEKLGIYSLAITVVLMLRVVLEPLNRVMLITIEKDVNQREILKQILTVVAITFSLLLPALIVGSQLIINIAVLNKYIDAIPVIAITLLIVPLMLPVETLLANINRVKDDKLFLLKSLLVFSVYTVILFSYTTYIPINLMVYALLVVISYFLAFIIYCVGIIRWSSILIISVSYIILSAIYLLVINMIL